MSTPTLTRDAPALHETVELARYTVPGGERVLYGQRVDDVVHISDHPAHGDGRSYVVERDLELDGVDALIADYLQQANQLGEIPMATSILAGYAQQP